MRGERTGAVGFETEMLARGPRRRQRAANSEIFWAAVRHVAVRRVGSPVPCARRVGLWWWWWCRRRIFNAATVR